MAFPVTVCAILAEARAPVSVLTKICIASKLRPCEGAGEREPWSQADEHARGQEAAGCAPT